MNLGGIVVSPFRVLTAVAAVHALSMAILSFKAVDRDTAKAASFVGALLIWQSVRVLGDPFDSGALFETFSIIAVFVSLFLHSRRDDASNQQLRKAIVIASVLASSAALVGFESAALAAEDRFLLANGSRALRGLFANPNDLSAFLLIAMPSALLSIANSRRLTLESVLAALAIVLSATAILSSGSRAGILGLVFIAVFMGGRALLRSLRTMRPHIAFGLILALCIGFAALTIGPGQSGFNQVVDDLSESGTDSGGSRAEWIGLGAEGVLQNYGLGLGPDSAQDFGSTRVQSEVASRQGNFLPHNLFVEVGVQLGIPGLILLVAAVVYSSKMSTSRDAREHRLLSDSAIRTLQLLVFVYVSAMSSSILDDAALAVNFLALRTMATIGRAS